MKSQTNQKELLEELIDVFVGIDEKIKLLHKDSSDVFLQLNSYLKDYYKKYGIITKNVTSIFDTTVGKKEMTLADEFSSIYSELKKYKSGTEKENLNNLNLLNQLNSKVNYISVMIRNFKQELTTFIFLATNYRLITNNENYDKETNNIIRNWENLAMHIQENLSELSKKFNALKISTSNLYTNSQAFYDDSINQIFSFFEDLKSSNVLISNKVNESSDQLKLLKDKMQNSKSSIGNIITHLQYHDIIRQKIEHIQSSHMKIVDSLKNVIEENNGDNTDAENERLALVSDISGLQSAQLILISKEYQNALEVITENFETIADDLAAVSSKSNEFSFEGKHSDTTIIKGVKTKLDKSLLVLDSFNLTSINKELSELTRKIEEVKEDASQNIFKPLEQFEKLAPKEVNGEELTNDESTPTNILLQLSSLARDILNKRDDLQNEINQTIDFSKAIVKDESRDEAGSFLEKEQIRLMVRISQVLERLDEENKQLDTLLSQNDKISSEIIKKLEDTINEVDYYELFENVLSEIIQSLNAINNQLVGEKQSFNNYEDIDNLKEIEALYTVASERIIHNNIIQGKGMEIEMPEPKSQDDEEDDLELF